MKVIKDIGASIRQRLLNFSKTDKRPFNEILQYYAMERFLYRLSQSHLADRFILKGALMLRVWQSSVYRPTMDIDMLGRSILSEKKILAQFKDVISVPVEPDGLTFNPDTLHTESITEQNLYQGIRVRFTGYLTTAKINMQIDIGFGDIVYPMPEKNVLPTILN